MDDSALAVRFTRGNVNHHLWLNNGTWFAAFTIHPTPITKERIRTSLRTKSLKIARQRRDEMFREIRRKGMTTQIHMNSDLALAA